MIVNDFGIYNVDPTYAGTAFGNAVAIWFSQKGIRIGWGRRPDGIFQCTPEEDVSIGVLVSVPLVNGIHCFLVGSSAFDPNRVAPIWREAIKYAQEAIRNRRKFYWSALIGPSPKSTGGNFTLAKAMRLGPLILKAADTYMREWTHNPLSDGLGRSEWGSWPVVVSSSNLAFDSEGAREIALRQLNWVCGLISVAWNCWWTVRNGPYAYDEPHELQVFPYAFPQEASLFRETKEPPRRYRTLPAWLDDAWLALGRTPHLQGAMGSFYEAIQLSLNHPSFALIGFVAAIEDIGAGPPANAEGKIKNRPNQKRAFTAGLHTIMAESTARKLADSFYGRRSLTRIRE